MNPGNFFAELRRRNIYKVAIAYAMVAWLLVQIATQTFPIFEIPSWCVRLVIVLLLLGFPIAMIFTWAYEITPEGIKRTEDLTPEESIKGTTGRKLNSLIIGVLLCAIAFLVFQRFRRGDGPAASDAPEKSIAVLPFDNFSDGKESAFFADGIQDDILTSLAKIQDLKVISRTSVMPYRGAGKNNLRANRPGPGRGEHPGRKRAFGRKSRGGERAADRCAQRSPYLGEPLRPAAGGFARLAGRAGRGDCRGVARDPQPGGKSARGNQADGERRRLRALSKSARATNRIPIDCSRISASPSGFTAKRSSMIPRLPWPTRGFPRPSRGFITGSIRRTIAKPG